MTRTLREEGERMRASWHAVEPTAPAAPEMTIVNGSSALVDEFELLGTDEEEVGGEVENSESRATSVSPKYAVSPEEPSAPRRSSKDVPGGTLYVIDSHELEFLA